MTKKIGIGVLIILLLGLAYFAISPLFKDVAVDDALPENIVAESENISDVPSGFDDLSPVEQEEMLKQMEEANKVPEASMDDEEPVVLEKEEVAEEETVVEDVESTVDVAPTTAVTFPIMSTFGHPASGNVRIIETTTGTVIRYEDFETINGPRLHLYLAKDLKADEFIDLGSIKGTSGNINYEVPEGVDIGEYKYVMYWCVPFRVLFNYAEIN